MSIGYACMTIGVPFTDQKSCILKSASESRFMDIISHNLSSLDHIIDYNIKNDIKLFRISSDLIPFGSSVVNNLPWWDMYSIQFSNLGVKILQSGMRVSMHAGHYTVLNSPNTEVVTRAILDLNYHAKVLDSLGIGTEHKIVLHVGGVYNEKEQAIARFIANYSKLEEVVKRRLVLENDDKSYNITDVLEMSAILDIPIIFDNLHNKINASHIQRDELFWIEECNKTWKEKDGLQKMHYSQQNPLKNIGSHSNTIHIKEFIEFYKRLNREDIDIMLEVKDKNLSAVKCINCTSITKSPTMQKLEWSKYKYSVLEKSHRTYSEICKLLRNKKEYSDISFYTLIESALESEGSIKDSIKALKHVWGYFKELATEKEKIKFLKDIDQYKKGEISIQRIKSYLCRMAVKYQRTNLLYSYYFEI